MLSLLARRTGSYKVNTAVAVKREFVHQLEKLRASALLGGGQARIDDRTIYRLKIFFSFFFFFRASASSEIK
jgi:hypothetical protein